MKEFSVGKPECYSTLKLTLGGGAHFALNYSHIFSTSPKLAFSYI